MTKTKYAALLCVVSAGAVAVPDQTVVDYRIDSTNNNQPTEHDLQVLVPVYHSDSDQVFVSGNLRYDDETSLGGGLAVGYRGGTEYVYGINAFYDIKDHHAGEQYSQAGIGGEFFGKGVEARANYYVSLSGDATFQSGEVVVDGNNIMGRATSLIGYGGGDIDIGARMYSTPDVEFWANVGAFNYDSRKGDGSEKGGSVGIEARLPIANGGSVRLGIKGEHVDSETDGTRNDTRFYASVNYPFGGTAGLPEHDGSRGYLEPLRRKGSIVRNATFDEALVNPFTARRVQSIWFADGTNAPGAATPGTGSESNPTDLNTALAQAGQDSVIVIQGNDGPVAVLAGGEQMQLGQLLLGGGSTHAFTGAKSGGAYSYTASGVRPTIAGNPGDVSITMANETEIQGVDFQGGDTAISTGPSDNVLIHDVNVDGTIRDSIRGEALANNVVIRDVVVDNAGIDGIFLDGNLGSPITDVTIENVTINNAGDDGISMNNANNVTISSSTIDGATDNGIQAFASNNVSVQDVQISNSGNDGVNLITSSDITINNAAVTASGSDGIDLFRTTNTTISNTTVDGAGDRGIEADLASNTTITDTTVSNAADDGVAFNISNGVTISDVTVDLSSDNGVQFVNSANVTATNLTVTNSGGDGVEIDNSTNVTITSANVSDSGANGIVIENGSDVVVIQNTTISRSVVDGIIIEDATTTVIDTVAIDRSGDDAIEITTTGGAQTVTISNSTMDISADNALEIDATGGTTALTFNDNTMTNSDGFGAGEHIEFVNTTGYSGTGTGNTADNGSASCNAPADGGIAVSGSFPGAC